MLRIPRPDGFHRTRTYSRDEFPAGDAPILRNLPELRILA